MFTCDQLIYIQLQKTGCTHIEHLLSTLLDGNRIGKHNPATQEQLASRNYFISSIRNPWDWYLSLWTFGVQGGGSLMRKLKKKPSLGDILKKPSVYHYNKLTNEAKLFTDVYDNNSNVKSFRLWLKLIHDPNYRPRLGKEFGITSNHYGFMTHRYLKLCCQNTASLSTEPTISNHRDLLSFDQKNCYINFFIKQESLEEDLIKAIEKVHPLSEEEKNYIYNAKKTNTSKRSMAISDYYDSESIELIRQRDKLLVDKFAYSSDQAEQPPSPE